MRDNGFFRRLDGVMQAIASGQKGKVKHPSEDDLREIITINRIASTDCEVRAMAAMVVAWLSRVPLSPESDALYWLGQEMRDSAFRALSNQEPMTAERGTMFVSAMVAAAACGAPVKDIATKLQASAEEAAKWAAREALRVLDVSMTAYRTSGARPLQLREARRALIPAKHCGPPPWAPGSGVGHEHAGHPDFIATVLVQGRSPEHPERHALIYTDGHVAITLREHCYFMWTLPDGRPRGGSIQTSDEWLASPTVIAILMMLAEQKANQ